MKPVLKVTRSKEDIKREQYQSKLADLAGKKAKGKLTFEDLDEKLNIILEILQDLMPPK